VTLLTGTNGAGKTSVLEGLYCLFSETQLDVSHLARYCRSAGIRITQQNGMQNIAGYSVYNYRLFWDECPAFGKNTCSVSANYGNGQLEWIYTKVKMSEIDASILRDAKLMGIPIDSTTDIARFKWQSKNLGIDLEKAQILSLDGGWHIVSPENKEIGACKYIDFAFTKAMPKELSLQTARKLTEALKLIHPQITDVRISKIENGLYVVLDGNQEATLATVGNGAGTWASTLYSIFELVERFIPQDNNSIPAFVLIDEIGTGVHYSVMSSLWKYIRDFTVQYPNMQLIATSHSDDCVRAFCETFIECKEKANLVNLHKTATNEIAATSFNASHFGMIMSGELEVRG
jgi:hypothetical protein